MPATDADYRKATYWADRLAEMLDAAEMLDRLVNDSNGREALDNPYDTQDQVATLVADLQAQLTEAQERVTRLAGATGRVLSAVGAVPVDYIEMFRTSEMFRTPKGRA